MSTRGLCVFPSSARLDRAANKENPVSRESSPWPIEPCAPEQVGLSSRRLERIGDLMRRTVDDGLAAGVITLVARRARIAHLECFGKMDLATGEPMREDAIFRIYSMTKPITCVAFMMLFEEGRFLLGEPVWHYLPEFKEVRVGVTGADGQQELVRPERHITIHDLLTHLGGLSYEVVHETRAAGGSLADFVTELCNRPLLGHPGGFRRQLR